MPKFKDPVCGMMVDPDRAAAKASYGGQVAYFCSTLCQQTYERTHRRD